MNRLLALFVTGLVVVPAVWCERSSAADFTVKMIAQTNALVFFRFNPSNITIAVGDTITWTNAHNTQHDTTEGLRGSGLGGLWASPLLSASTGDTFSFLFETNGSYPYRCATHADPGGSHPEQTGAVFVATSSLPPTVTITNLPNGTVFLAPATFTFGASASDPDGNVTQVEFFNGGTSLGVDPTSPYAVTISGLAAGNYTLSAVATDNSLVTATNEVGITVNNAPTVTVTNPINGAAFLAPASFTINATAADADGSIAQVEFFTNNVLVFTDTSAPYSFTLMNVAPASYTLRAVATDNLGAKATNSVTVTVNPNQPPMVAITNPASGAAFQVNSNLTVGVAATDSDGSVANVTLLTNGVSAGASPGPGFNFNLAFPVAGNFTLTAIATDNLGLMNTSATVNLFILTNALLTNFVTLSNGAVQFNVLGISNQTYFIDASADLSNWSAIRTNIAPSNLFPVTDPVAPGNGVRFYRSRQLSQ